MYQVFRQCVAQSLYPHQRARCKTLLAETRHEKNRGFGRARPEICLREAKTVLQNARHFATAPFCPHKQVRMAGRRRSFVS